MTITNLEAQNNLKNQIAFLSSLEGIVPTFETLEADLVADGIGSRFVATHTQQQALRATLASLFLPGYVSNFLLAQINEYAEAAGAPTDVSLGSAFIYITDDMVANSHTVKSRELTYGTPTADGGNEGDGVILRLNVDHNGFPLEALSAETKIAEIVDDQKTSGATRHNEVMEIRGEPLSSLSLDIAAYTASGLIQRFRVFSETAGLLNNPSFSDADGTEDPDVEITDLEGITDWLPTISGSLDTDYENFEIDLVNYFRSNDDATPASLRILANNAGVRQNLATLAFSPYVPYILTCVYNREEGSAIDDCKIKLTWGSKTFTSAAIPDTTTGWNRLTVPLDEDVYYINWKTDQPYIQVEVLDMATGFMLIDEVLLAVPYYIDGGYYLPIGGAIPFALGDFYSWTDSAGADSKTQRYLSLTFGRSVPSTSGTETWTDP